MRASIIAGVLVLVLGIAGFLARDVLRNWLVVLYTPQYQAPVAPAAAQSPGGIRWVKVVEGLKSPTDVQFVPGGKGAAIVLEKGGTARYVVPAQNGEPAAKPVGPAVLELTVRADSELGLLGLAFAPDYATSAHIYVDSNPEGGDMRTRVAEWTLPRDRLGKAAAEKERVVLEVKQPYSNHNGGQLAFGADGFLYVALGDGGFRNDPHGNGQDLSVLLGKLLRLDVNARTAGGYGIPKDNPFIATRGARPEIWAYGLRNPWRFSFDPHGRIVTGDVGQDTWEEIDVVTRGANLGWNAREGTHCFSPKEGCRSEGLTAPVFEYGRESGTSVTGGYVYTGTAVPALAGEYVFGDFVSGKLWAMKLPGPTFATTELAPARELGKWPFLVSSFGRDEAGELYLVDYAGGAVYRMAPR